MITTQEFENVAKLAKLHIHADQQELLRDKMQQVIALIDPLRTLDIDQMRYDLGIEEHDTVSQTAFPVYDNTCQPAQMDRNIFLSNARQVINDSIVIQSPSANIESDS